MRNLKTILLSFIACTTFSACTNDTEEVLGQDTEIRLTSEITPSRVTSLDYQSTQIVAGQQVGVTITGAKADHKNVAWTAEADGALTNTGSTLYYGTGEATIKAYHPYNSAWTGTSHTFSVNTDQSTDAGYLGSDLLWATASSGKTANAVPLTFTHKLAKINVTLQSTDITDLSGATISICGTNIATNFNPSTGALSAATANVQEIKAGVTTASAKTASAIIVPQTVAASTQFIKVTLGEKIFYHKLSAEKTFVSGKSYSYTLTMKEKKVEVDTEGDINDWENGDEGNIGDANEENVSSYSNGVAYIAEAGELSTVIPNEEKLTITSLKITGELNGTDIKFLREMAGQDYSYQATNGQLTALDLSGATIVAGGDAYTYDPASDDSKSCNTSNNIIGKCMFAGCSLESIILPNNITTISAYAFEECTNLQTVSIAETNSLKTILNEAFDKCSSLTSVDALLKNVTHIGEKAFYQCQGLSSVTIAEGTEKIYNSAFYDCRLTSITLPSTIKNIQMYAFNSNVGDGIKTIRCKATTPPTLQGNVYNEYDNFYLTADDLVVYISEGTLDAYEQANGWSQFAGKFVEE